jgi:hypothetical protein
MKLLRRFLFTTIFLLTGFFAAIAQKPAATDLKQLRAKEDSLEILADSMINGQSPAKRFRSDSSFVRMLVRALLIKQSFNYKFSRLKTVSQQYPPDSSFRIFTWQLKKDEYMYLQKGAIQMRTPTGELKLIPLFDGSMYTSKPVDSVRGRNNWIGAIYYNIIQKTHAGKTYYTLLGYDDFSIASNRKWLEVLTFNAQGEPVFGGSVISYKEDTVKKADANRFMIEYKKEARTTFNYNPEMDMIIYDHLISETEEPDRKETYIPDGDFEAFKWKDGQWVHVDKVFDYKVKDGEFPMENLLRDKDGNINEEKLIEQSEKNKARGQKPAAKTPVKKSKP